MHFKNRTSLTRKILYGIMSLGVILGSFGAGNTPVVHAQEAQTSTLHSPSTESTCINSRDYTCEQWYLDQTGIRQAWQNPNYRGNSSIVVAVLDTGVDYNHEDLAGNIWKDGSGHVIGRDFVDGDGDPSPALDTASWNTGSWHGTAVAGIIGAVHGNSIGVDGIAWNVRILPVRVEDSNTQPFDFCGTGENKDRLAAGIRYAADFPEVRIIVISLAIAINASCVEDAISYAVSKGKLIIAGSGNTGSGTVLFPASLPSVIAVGATDKQDHRATFSNYGDALDVAAPGVEIPILLPGNQYTTNWGTSFSAPQVAGLAALIIGANPQLIDKPSLVRGYIKDYAEEVGGYTYQNGFNPQMGWGRINAYASLMAAAPPSVQSCPQSGGVILYYNANYDCNGLGENNGYVQRSSAGWQNITGGMNENASSVIMPSGWSVLLYENANRGGGKKCLNSTDAWLSDFNYQGNFPGTSTPVADHASSFEVFTNSGCGTTPPPPPPATDGIEVCDSTNYGTPCKTYTYVNNSACTNLSSDGWDNRIESLRFKGSYIGGYEIILYDDNSCGTYIARLGSDINTLGLLNNLTGSFRIEQNGPPPPPPAPGDKIVLYDGTNYGGESTILTYVDNNFCTNLSTRSWSDRADSLQFFGSYISNYDVVAYDDTACNTYIARYGSNMVDLGDLKNRISSVRIEQHAIIIPPLPDGSIKLWDGSNYSGSSKTFPYDNNTCTNLLPQGWDNRARSLQFIGGYIGAVDVILHDDNNCNTYVARYGSDASTLGAWDGKVGSIRIERHAPPKPDLIPYPRSGRSNPVIISPVAGTSTNGTLYAGEPVYIDWGFKNNGSVNALAFNVTLTINGQTIIDYPFGGLSAGSTNGFDDWSTTWITPGTFTVTLTLDSNSSVDESDEGNNTWNGQFTWNMRPPNQLTKLAPQSGSSSQGPNLTLSWNDSSGVNSYSYCLDRTNDNACDTPWTDAGTATSAAVSVLPGSTYYWQVRANNSGGSTYADGNTWWSFSTVPPVPNDDFNNAIQISTLPNENSQTTIGATLAGDDPTFPCITGQRYNAVWYKYIPSTNGVLTVNTFDSSFDTVLGIWSGNRGSLLSQACNDDASGLQSEVQFSFVAGTVYYIEVAGYSADSAGTLKLNTAIFLSQKIFLPLILR